MALSYAAIHEALINDPTLVFIQIWDGTLMRLWTDKWGMPLHVYSGSFNPLHDGHKAIYREATVWDKNACYELSINRFDKPAITPEDLERRARQFIYHGAPLLITNVAKFVEKAGVLRTKGFNSVFHVGADTLNRVFEHASVAEVAGYNCGFIYYERIMNGDLVPITSKVSCNCTRGTKIPEDLMRMSSTALRNTGKVLG